MRLSFLSAIFPHLSRLNIVDQAAHALVVSGIIAWLVFKYRLISSFTPIGTNAVSVFLAFRFHDKSVGRSGIEAFLLPLRPILCLLHRDLVDM
jgi:hypothetical protein